MLTPSLTFFQCSENRELQEKVKLLEQQLATDTGGTSLVLADKCASGEHIDELKRKIQSQVTETLLFLKYHGSNNYVLSKPIFHLILVSFFPWLMFPFLICFHSTFIPLNIFDGTTF